MGDDGSSFTYFQCLYAEWEGEGRVMPRVRVHGSYREDFLLSILGIKQDMLRKSERASSSIYPFRDAVDANPPTRSRSG